MRRRTPWSSSILRAGSTSSWYGPVPTTSTTLAMPDPGELASSDTLGISSGGRLSMTNQPRSSRMSAACDRPAPDNPVITMNSFTHSAY